MSVLATSDHAGNATDDASNRPYLVVSGDSHAGPSLERTLRAYCPPRYLTDFDVFVTAIKDQGKAGLASGTDPKTGKKLEAGLAGLVGVTAARTQAGTDAMDGCRTCAGQEDPAARLADMDADGITAELIFAGGGNGELLPWLGSGFNAGLSTIPSELWTVGCEIWNTWLADFVASSPERLLGVMQIPVWDVDAAIAQVTWGREHGLRAVNLPAPRSDFPSYNEDVYEPFWAACADLAVPLLTHSAGGEPPLGTSGRGAMMVTASEVHWLGRRALWQMIFGSVFERHPSLRLVFTEQRVAWVPETLREMDATWDLAQLGDDEVPPRRPSEYWTDNCFMCGSFLAPFEVALRDQVGLRNLLWGSDYPHPEGTWPRTRAAMRNTFAGVPPDDVRVILEENGLRVYGLDEQTLRPVADRIGPRPDELATPLAPDEFPEYRGLAFRERGAYA